MKIATNEKLFQITSQLWKEAYFHAGESLNDEVSGPGQKEDDSFKWHPYGAFDCNKGYMVSLVFHLLVWCRLRCCVVTDSYSLLNKYIDRIGFRLPTNLAEQIGKQVANEQLKEASLQSAKKFRPRPIQRSLTPHFDCCPETFYDANKNKWRPIQCFVSLTDNSQPNTGGFEAAPGFHREFSTWTKNGRRYVDTGDRQPHPRPCVGEYTHINPTHDREILDRVQHIPVKAGYAVFWDNRIPHGNAYRNDPIESDVDMSSKIQADKPSIMLKRSGARAVVYCSFLPDVELNRSFIRSQLLDFKLGRAPRAGDRWIKQDDNEMISDDKAAFAQLTELGCKLLGIHEW